MKREPKPITEKDGVHLQWKEEAEEVRMETLQKFLRKLLYNYQHDYGTIVHAMSAGMVAAFNAMNNSSQGGITGFQAGALAWEMVRQFHMDSDGPMRLVNFRNLMYPQYEEKFTTVPKEAWEWVQEQAKAKLGDDAEVARIMEHNPKLMDHLQSIVDGKVPFGLKIGGDF